MLRLSSELDTKGVDRMLSRLDRADKLVAKAAFDIVAEAVKAIKTGKKSGRQYGRGAKLSIRTRRMADGDERITRVSRRRIVHRASAPGEAPASDTGALAASGFARRLRAGLWQAGFTTAYARILEGRLNRPYLSTAMEKVAPKLYEAARRLFGGED